MQAASHPSHTPPRKARLGIQFTAVWEVIDDARSFFVQALTHAVPDAVRREEIGIAAHELMENAFRYSPASEVSVAIEVLGDDISITAENETTPDHIVDLDAQVNALAEAPDPLVYYQQKMLEVADRTEGSGLGLARIRWEASMSVACEVVGSRVRVRAFGSLTR
jgi:hypothetical protein